MHYNSSMVVTKFRKSSKPPPNLGESDGYLRRLGERVRTLRSGRGMARKMLARQARVSERYLAQLESGEGNCSIILLRRIARALGLPIEEMVYDRPDRSAGVVLLAQFLERLSPAALENARTMLQAQFGAANGKLHDRIALIGLRGGGKSTLGALLAAERGVPFIELDREVESASGATLSEIFEMFGQEQFRRMERDALEHILTRHDRFVLATGGSIVTEPATYERLLSNCFTIWVRAEPHEHMSRVIAQGDLRPMGDSTRAMADLVAILNSREPLYAKADATIVTTGKSPKETLGQAIGLLDSAPA
jgi:XRE family transcriptional regulator, aerobic/anaerobic benzoate catabolism transcriptional regulator